MQDSWTVVKLGDVAKVRSGFAFKSGDMGEIGAPIIKIKNISPPNVDIKNVQRVPMDLVLNNSRIEKFSLQGGDILIAMTGATVGKVGRMPSSVETFYLNQRVGKVFSKGKKANYDYLYYVLSQDANVSQMFSLADGSAQANISGLQIENISFLLPPVYEQTAIANVLLSLDKKIELNTQLNQTLESMAQALFKSWFVDFDPVIDNAIAAGNPIPEPLQARAERRRQRLHEPVPEGQPPLQPLPAELRQLFPNSFQETEELGWVPEGWSARTCGEISKRIGMGPFGSNIKTSTFVDQGIPVINGQQLKSFLLTEAGYSFITESHFERLKNSSVKSGDIVITHRGTLGQVSLIPRNSRFEKYLVSQSQFFMSPNQSVALSSYLISYFQSRLGQSRLLENVSQVGVPAIARPTSHLKNLYVLVPPNFVQSEFDKFCGAIFDRITSLRSEIDKLTRVRDYLLPKLLSGQLRIPDAEAQLAEAGL